MKRFAALIALIVLTSTGCRTTQPTPRPQLIIEAQKTEHQPATIAARIIFQ